MTMGRQIEAIARMKESQELDPLSLIINDAIGWANYMARRYDDATEQLLRTVGIGSELSRYVLDSRPGLSKNRPISVAITEGEKGVNLSGGSPLLRAALAQTYAEAGRMEEARQVIDELTKLARHKYVAPHFFAGIHIGREKTIERSNTWRNLSKNTATGSSICTWTRAWTLCGTTPRFPGPATAHGPS